MNVGFPQLPFNFLVNFGHTLCSVDPDAVVPLLKTLHNGQSFIRKSGQSLFNSLLVVISPSTSLGSHHDPFHKHLFGTVEVNQISNNHVPTHLLLKLVPVLLVSGKPVEQVPPFPIFCHCILEQAHHDVRRDQLALFDIAVDGLCELATFLLLLPQQIARG